MRTQVMLLFLAAAVPLAAEESASRQIDFGLKVAQKGLWQEARFRFERAAQADPDNAAAFNNLAIALEQMGDFQGARQAYDKALALKPQDAYIQQNYDLFREADDKRNRKNKRRRPQAQP